MFKRSIIVIFRVVSKKYYSMTVNQEVDKLFCVKFEAAMVSQPLPLEPENNLWVSFKTLHMQLFALSHLVMDSINTHSLLTEPKYICKLY